MLVTIELSDTNMDRIQDYLMRRSLWSRIYYSEPHYRVALVECDASDGIWLALLC